ncbi:MAG: Sec-independent protein translocase subunit TatA [Gammaproteobacteria bacterium]|nr:Sec-independent protein translocase subunit TatA [Gammaproteobacteria bacterium]MDP2139907.1 Sec-independent protein translocase subunit TatA [Gammaproteobacteria bacterium]MDP2347727.1 Sec-independent protein translocase subunit TatA [Gammaproteobacteria bacterium]
MGFGGIGIWQLIIILVIVVMLFGTKKLRNLGSDLGGALKGFKTAMKDEDGKDTDSDDDGTVKKVGDATTMKSEKAEDKD